MQDEKGSQRKNPLHMVAGTDQDHSDRGHPEPRGGIHDRNNGEAPQGKDESP
jgi:hypothetical protein